MRCYRCDVRLGLSLNLIMILLKNSFQIYVIIFRVIYALKKVFIIKKDWLRNKLKKDSTLNPFNQKFDLEKIILILNEMKEKNIADASALTLLPASVILNNYSKNIYDMINQILNECGHNNIEEIQRILFGIANNNYIVAHKTMSHNEKVFQDIMYTEVPSLNGTVSAFGAVEQSIDILNAILTYFCYFGQNNKEAMISNQELEDKSLEMFGLTNILGMIKTAYETALWENGWIKKTEDDDLFVLHLIHNYEIIKDVGILRTQQNMQEAPEEPR